MSSSSKEKVTQTTTSETVDARITLQKGIVLKDSLLNSNDDQVVSAALKPMVAAWDIMAKNGRLNLLEVTGMGNKLIDQLNKSQIRMSKEAEVILREGTKQFETLLRQQTLTVELVGDVSGRAFDLTESALDVVAEVKTANFAELSKSVMVFALAAMLISSLSGKG
ncbi:hypothetical protein JI58_02225 [Marinosulfonomonas sp. PRT-SC04]|nr:hypothetical protein JI58_02225 [Marinosulfonomonas sp. PRT-SC04]